MLYVLTGTFARIDVNRKATALDNHRYWLFFQQK